MPRRKQNYPKRLKSSSRRAKEGSTEQQTCDSGGDNSDLTSDEEGEEDEPMNSGDSQGPDSNDEADDKDDSDDETDHEELIEPPIKMTRAAETTKQSFGDMKVGDAEVQQGKSSPSLPFKSKDMISKTESSNFGKSFRGHGFSAVMAEGDQPLDLSKKAEKKKRRREERKETVSNGHSSSPVTPFPSSLQSLQQRFGGDFPIEPPRRPSNSIPLQSTMIQGKSILRSPLVVPTPNHGGPRISSPSLDNQKPRPSPKTEKVSNVSPSPVKKPPRLSPDEIDPDDKNNKYTMHRCSCQKTYTSLYALSMHIQETGHVPGSAKAASLMDYPKLVRGQDMWLNQESEQTRRILRCMQCGESFKSLPMLTVHMMQTQHYTKIVSSDHGRRSHKCSAYCEKELDRECIFKCKVCHDTFTDMEGLANHMIMSGHHKRQVLRSQNYPDLGMRARRKRYYSEENNSCNTPTVASLLEYKRKCISHSSNGFSVSEASGINIDSAISCENCGHKIEMHNFVEHVRLCLRQKPDVIGALKHKLNMDEEMRNRRNSGSSISSPRPFDKKLSGVISPIRTPPSPIHSPTESAQKPKSEKMAAASDTNEEKMENSNHQNKETKDTREPSLRSGKPMSDTSDVDHPMPLSPDVPMDIEIKKEIPDSPEPNNRAVTPCPVKQERCPSVSPTPELHSPKIPKSTDRATASPLKNDERAESRSSLDIIDPDASQPKKEGSSALKAMESFIQRSFSSKFDHHRTSMSNIMNPLAKSSLPLPGSGPMDAQPDFNYFGKLRKFFNSFQPFDHEMLPKKSFTAGVPLPHTEKSTSKESDKKAKQTEKPKTNTKEEDKSEVKRPKKEANTEDAKSPSRNSETGTPESLVNKYLTVEEGEASTNKKGSALDSLSSFVYGQPMTSEHPLDSLQRLLTKTDIPKMLQQHLEPVSCRQLISPSDMSLPLNLSLKQSRSDDENEEDDREESVMREMPDGHSPLLGPDGELLEYKCAACSRQFASKGSYRYHLSRCHLSSVKKYGIKEAFNMSPYVYLPLDHTAKFTKYYQMAHELANKGK